MLAPVQYEQDMQPRQAVLCQVLPTHSADRRPQEFRQRAAADSTQLCCTFWRSVWPGACSLYACKIIKSIA
jgi:hypothetical protein